jgi:hypothetical protein
MLGRRLGSLPSRLRVGGCNDLNDFDGMHILVHTYFGTSTITLLG